MRSDIRLASVNPFDSIRRVTDTDVEFWLARELMPLLGYLRWEKFENAIDRAKVACKNAGSLVESNFRGAAKIVKTGIGVDREVSDYKLSRYAAYLVAMNGDPRKPEIAAAQNYFAVKTREAELRTIAEPKVVAFEEPWKVADRIRRLWVETENCKRDAHRSQKSSLEIARLCGELLLEAKAMMPKGRWEAFRDAIKHPKTKKPLSSSTTSLYQRIAENWEEIEASQVKTLLGAQKYFARKHRLETATEPQIAAATQPAPIETTIAPSSSLPSQSFDLIREAIELADRLGGFDDRQRDDLRNALFGATQRAIVGGQCDRTRLERLLNNDQA